MISLPIGAVTKGFAAFRGAKSALILAAVLGATGFGFYLVNAIKAAGAAKIHIAMLEAVNQRNQKVAASHADSLARVSALSAEARKSLESEIIALRARQSASKERQGEIELCAAGCWYRPLQSP